MSQKRYLVFLRSVPGKGEAPSPDQMKQMYSAFEAWRQRHSSSIVDLGGRLGPDGKVVRTTGVTDGPFTEAKEVVGGYMIIVADGIEAAVEIARECPGVVRPGSSVEVRPILVQ